jgi:hypothetical protein
MPQARSYVLQVILMTAALLGATALFNELTDPYGIYQTFCRVGANANKPGQKGHDRLVKAYAIRDDAPDALLLGTSRVQYGLNPDDPSLLRLAKRPYNGALLGSNIYLALRYLQHAEAISHVRLAVVGLDPLMFDDGNQDATRDFSEQRLAVDAQGAPQSFGLWTDLPSTLLSLDTTRLSVRTWRKQSAIVSDLTAHGQRSPGALQRLFGKGLPIMEQFLNVDAEYAQSYRRARWPQDGAPSASMQAFEKLLDFAVEHNIRLELYLTPEHVHLHEVAALTGQSAAIEAWTHRIVTTVEARRRKAALPNAITLWDFAGLNALTQEPVPQNGATTPLQWFWEPTHAKDTLGHMVLSCMLDKTPDPLAATLGEPITEANVAARLHARQEALKRWEEGHQDDIVSIRARLEQERVAHDK